MAYRLDIKRILSMNFFHDLPQIMLGCALAAIATDLFLFPTVLPPVALRALPPLSRRSARRAAYRFPLVFRRS